MLYYINMITRLIHFMQNICPKKEAQNNWPAEESTRVYAEGERLQKEGHICVRYLESFPPQLKWCGNKICSYV